MLLKLIRTYHRTETRGVLYVDNQYFCSTIEPGYGSHTHLKDKRYPIPKDRKGCIPEGWYRVEVTRSPKYNRLMPLLRMVPGFEGIRIHAGMTVQNTRGCICVGERTKEEQLTNILIQAQEKNEQIFIAIATEYSLVRQLSNNDEIYLCPSFTY